MKKLIDINKIKLQLLYIDRKYSQDKVAKILHCSQWAVSNRLRAFNIKTRSKTCNLVKRKYEFDRNFLKSISFDIAWILGLLVSDGFVTNNAVAANFGLKLKRKDEDVIFKVKRILKYQGPILTGMSKVRHKGVIKEFPYSLLKINERNTVEQLEQIGIKQNKTLNEIFLECISETEDEKTISSFIRGIYDGDGSVLYDKKRNSMCFQIVGTLQLLSKIQQYLIYYCCVNKTALTENIKGVNHYALRYRGNLQAVKILKWVYKYSNSFNRMSRKYKNFCKIRRAIKK
jgi:hypothetical protein